MIEKNGSYLSFGGQSHGQGREKADVWPLPRVVSGEPNVTPIESGRTSTSMVSRRYERLPSPTHRVARGCALLGGLADDALRSGLARQVAARDAALLPWLGAALSDATLRAEPGVLGIALPFLVEVHPVPRHPDQISQ